MTGPASARVLADKRQQGAVVYGEVTAAALATASQGDKGSWSHGAAFLTSPPLRPNPETPEMLMDMLSRWKLNQTGGKRVGSVWGDV
jgi:dihydropyrimidinase